MKITELVSMIGIHLSNEELDFVTNYGDQIRATSLDEHSSWVAQNLLRKGVYELSNDKTQINKVKNVFHVRTPN